MTSRLEQKLTDRRSHNRRARRHPAPTARRLDRTSARKTALWRFLPPMSRRVARRLPNSAVRRLASADAFVVSDDFQQDLEAQRGKGRPLDATVAQRMGQSLGQDVSDVRIHTDQAADRMADSISARAFAQGKDLFFSHGAYDPQSESGQYTLAHELAHATDTGDRPTSVSSGKTVVGAANDPAEARADAVAQSAVSALRRQEIPEEEELQALRRQEMPEEEELQALRRQEMPEEEELQALRRQEIPEEEELQALRRQEMPEEEELQALRRQEAEEATETEEGSATEVAELDRQCERELGRLQRWMLSPGGMALQTLRAFDSALGNWIDHMSLPDTQAVGIDAVDTFGIILHLVPGLGPVARWIGDSALRAATTRAAMQTARSTATSMSGAGSQATNAAVAERRADFASLFRAASAGMADTLARNVDAVLRTYENGIDGARQRGDSEALQGLLEGLESENEQVRSVGPEQYREAARRFEIELYRQFCLQTGATLNTNAYEIAYQDEPLELGGIIGLPHAAQQRLIRDLEAASDIQALGRMWGLTEKTTTTEVPAHGPM